RASARTSLCRTSTTARRTTAPRSSPTTRSATSTVRGYHGTPAYEKAMRKRKVWVEPLFGEAKEWHGLRRFRLRGLRKVNSEGVLVAAGQNLKRYLAATGWGRRHAPCGCLTTSSTSTTMRC